MEGKVDLDYAPSGLAWRLTCPAANALEPTGEGEIEPGRVWPCPAEVTDRRRQFGTHRERAQDESHQPREVRRLSDVTPIQQLSYPFRFLGAPRETDGLFRWCVRTIRAGDIQLQSAPQAIKAIASGAL